ncbi:MAG TPA: flagellar basal body rod protein FlgB [Gammaproteobacteria bacterium]|nr:flagellar basal body rod protein FlgB [Gammaproteobacteria bacterium]
MPINIDSALGIHADALALRSRRAEVLANNLANADTPRYKARDFDFKSALAQAQGQSPINSVRLVTTQSGHIAANAGASRIDAELQYRIPSQPSLDGNTVDTQIEQAEFTQNAIQYQTSLTFLSGKIRGLLTAIRGD